MDGFCQKKEGPVERSNKEFLTKKKSIFSFFFLSPQTKLNYQNSFNEFVHNLKIFESQNRCTFIVYIKKLFTSD